MLVIKCNGTLDGSVADHVTVGEILSNDARARLILLGNVMLVAGGVFGVIASKFADAGGA